MNLQLESKLALVTGSTAGIGFAIAKAFPPKGRVIICCSSTESGTGGDPQAAAQMVVEEEPSEVAEGAHEGAVGASLPKMSELPNVARQLVFGTDPPARNMAPRTDEYPKIPRFWTEDCRN